MVTGRLVENPRAVFDADGAMDSPIIYEVVFDLSSPRPRIAYLREVTWLRTAALIAANVEPDDDATDLLDDLVDPVGPDAPTATATPASPINDPFFGDEAMEEQPLDDEAVRSPEAEPATPAGKRIGRWTAG